MSLTKTIPTSKQPALITDREVDLEAVNLLAKEGDFDAAYKLANQYLKQDPNDWHFLVSLTYLMMETKKPVLAYHLAKRCTELAPRAAAVWANAGKACQELWLSKEAERMYKRGLKFAKGKSRAALLINLTGLLIDIGRFADAEPHAQEALRLDPESEKARANLGFCQLAQRNWAEGWANYRGTLGTKFRTVTPFEGAEEWQGEKGKKVVLHYEQGVGDVICFSSMIPDIAKENDVVLEVDPKLHGLMNRSFDVPVYNSFRQTTGLTWDEKDQHPDYYLPLGQAAEYYRTDADSFDGRPFLVPDPDRLLMWQSLFASKKKPVIGIAWSGGIERTASRYRQWNLEQLLPLMESVDAHWVSLQYRSARAEIAEFKEKHPHIDIQEYPHATLTHDYDDTAGMVAALDHVVCMQTAVGHLAGGLGIPAWVFVPTTSQWRYGEGYEDSVWYDSVRLIRQTKAGQWGDDIKRIAKELNAHYPGIPEATGKAARSGKLRSDSGKVRTLSVPDRRSATDHASA